jgi:N-glycosylase/DNA lyase
VEELDYIGVAHGRVIEVIQEEDKVTFFNTNEEDFKNIWFDYFDLGRDYSKVKKELAKDEILRKSVEYGYGIRILNQEYFEILISFIISARNSIPSIMKSIKKISEKWGRAIEYKGSLYYTFPTAEEIKEANLEEIKETGASFRSKYILDTIYNVNNCGENLEYNLEHIASLNDDDCHDKLQNFKGVGAKVADCVMLFSMEKYSAFPVDVWVKRAMIHFYNAEEASLTKIRIFARNKFGDLSGFAQQYLFYYARENKISI